ncbi:MAG TPA: hypothetical protein VJN43_07445 [Bryobacteraceae bacterium]|nr:hypothetical protein [Bryobacteraceae bacterium]
MQPDSIALEHDRQVDRDTDRGISAGRYIYRRQREPPLVTLGLKVIPKLRAQIVAVKVQGLFVRVEREHPVIQVEMANGQIHDGLKGAAPRRTFLGGRWEVGLSVWKHNDVSLRLLQAEIAKINEVLIACEESQIELNPSDAQERSGAGGFLTVDHEIGNHCTHGRQAECKTSNFGFTARTFLGKRDNFLLDIVAEPTRVHHDDQGRYNHNNRTDYADSDIAKNSGRSAH